MIVFDYRIFQYELELMEQQAQDAFNSMLQQPTVITQQVNEPVATQEV